MYSRYVRSLVYGSKVSIRLWSSATGAVPEPFRIVLMPCTSANYTTLSATSNIVTLEDMPHCTSRLVSPGAAMPHVHAYSSMAAIWAGSQMEDEIVSNSYSSTSGADPTNLVYWLIGYQNMAGTTNLDLQAEVTIEFYCRFYDYKVSILPQISWNGLNDNIEPAPTPTQVLTETKEETKVLKVEEPEYELLTLQVRPGQLPPQPLTARTASVQIAQSSVPQLKRA